MEINGIAIRVPTSSGHIADLRVPFERGSGCLTAAEIPLGTAGARFRELADLTHGSLRFSSEDRTMLPVTSIPSPAGLWLLLAGICALFMRLRSRSVRVWWPQAFETLRILNSPECSPVSLTLIFADVDAETRRKPDVAPTSIDIRHASASGRLATCCPRARPPCCQAFTSCR
jgi:hypothetical protein